MKVTRIILLFLMMFVGLQSFAKKYPWKGLDHEVQIELVKQTSNSSQLVKVYGIGGSVDKAMDQALQDAVVAAIFYGYSKPKPSFESHPSLCKNMGTTPVEFYTANQAYFDEFFKSGRFLEFVQNVNTGYPSGENNLPVKGGRKVCLNVKIEHDALRVALEQEGIIRAL